MAAVLPIPEIVQCVASSCFRLVQSRPAGEIASNLNATLSPCFADERLGRRLEPIALVLSTVASNSESASAEIESRTLGWALLATIENLSDLQYEAVGFSDLLGTARDKLERSILKGSEPPPLLSGVFAVPRPRDVSDSLVERQMVDTLRLTVFGALHDANHALTVLTSGISRAKKASTHLNGLVEEHVHRLPDDVAPLVPRYAGAIAGNVGEIETLLGQTDFLIRAVQALLNSSGRSPKDLDETARLFDEGGFMHRIGLTLKNVQAKLNGSDAELERIFALSRTHGQYVPEAVFREGMGVLETLKECFDVFQDLVVLIRELLELLQDVVAGLHQESGPIRFDGSLALLKPRMIGAVMSKGVTVNLDLSPDGWPVWGHPVHIAQILLNLACNARDAMECSGSFSLATRNVSLRSDDVDRLEMMDSLLVRPKPKIGDYVMMTIQDSGPGIPAHVLPRIFDLSVSGKGSSGVGLAVVLKLVSDRGGFVVVDTRHDSFQDRPRGTTFLVFLPRYGGRI